MLVLRKSCGPWSAGTPIEMVTQPGKTRDLVTVRTLHRVPLDFEHIQSYSEFDKPKSIIKKKDYDLFDVALDNIVERRKMPATVVSKNRKQRRLSDPIVIAKRIAYENQ